MSRLVSIVPPRLQPKVKRLVYAMRSIAYSGDTVFCVCCNGQFRKFAAYGARKRPGAQCPRCGSLERHRLLWLYLKERTSFSTDHLRVLHIAPEPCFDRGLATMSNLQYTTADLNSPSVDIRFDITDIPYPDGYFDVILCNHVLEHVEDDIQAMRELRRICRPGGWAIVQVPINPELEVTFEDPSIVTPMERARAFGQHDHVRSYGRDYPDRLRRAGWHVRIDHYAAELGERVVERHGLTADHDQDIFLCVAPAVSQTRPRPGVFPDDADDVSEPADLTGTG